MQLHAKFCSCMRRRAAAALRQQQQETGPKARGGGATLPGMPGRPARPACLPSPPSSQPASQPASQPHPPAHAPTHPATPTHPPSLPHPPTHLQVGHDSGHPGQPASDQRNLVAGVEQHQAEVGDARKVEGPQGQRPQLLPSRRRRLLPPLLQSHPPQRRLPAGGLQHQQREPKERAGRCASHRHARASGRPAGDRHNAPHAWTRFAPPPRTWRSRPPASGTTTAAFTVAVCCRSGKV